MRRPLLLALAIFGTALAAAVQFVPPAAAQAQRDWSQTVAVTPEGGFRMGNPAAPVKLVEFGSLTCPHCAHFAKEGMPALMADVKRGRVSFEFRNFIRDPADLAGALLSRCAEPARYFGLTDRIFETQEEWFGKLTGMSQAQQQEIGALPQQQQIARYASVSGLTGLAAQGGVAGAKANACLADTAALEKLIAMRRAATDLGVNSTPSFLLNGKLLQGVHDWSALQPHLDTKG